MSPDDQIADDFRQAARDHLDQFARHIFNHAKDQDEFNEAAYEFASALRSMSTKELYQQVVGNYHKLAAQALRQVTEDVHAATVDTGPMVATGLLCELPRWAELDAHAVAPADRAMFLFVAEHWALTQRREPPLDPWFVLEARA